MKQQYITPLLNSVLDDLRAKKTRTGMLINNEPNILPAMLMFHQELHPSDPLQGKGQKESQYRILLQLSDRQEKVCS